MKGLFIRLDFSEIVALQFQYSQGLFFFLLNTVVCNMLYKVHVLLNTVSKTVNGCK